jgi:uncharacterized membrane protein YecN with MAPEG domain
MLMTTLLYAALFALFALGLSFKVGSSRVKTAVSVLYGDPVNMDLAENVRRHQNFLEYVPMILILMGAIELSGGSGAWLHGFGIVLIVSRIAHAVGLRHDDIGHKGRLLGMIGTVGVTIVAAGYAIWLYIKPLLG